MKGGLLSTLPLLRLWVRCYGLDNPRSNSVEDPKNIKDDKKEKESPELKEELSDEELKGVTGGVQWTQQDYKEEEQLGLWYPGM